MPFLIIRGTFRLLGTDKNGDPYGLQPDGDSIQFLPKRPSLLDELERPGRKYELSAIGSINLRFEGIDASELHYAGTHQPWEPCIWAWEFLTKTLGLDPVEYSASGLTVSPPTPNDGQEGYILSRSLEGFGRPVSFVYAGEPPEADGEWLYLTPEHLRESVNYKALEAGWVYPLFYETLFGDLRAEMMEAAEAALENYDDPGWPHEWSLEGAPASGIQPLVDEYTVFPKLFRRLVDCFKVASELTQEKLKEWMDDHDDNDELWLLPEFSKTHFDDVVEVTGGKVRLLRAPWNLVFVSRRTRHRLDVDYRLAGVGWGGGTAGFGG
jgi:hypothetical protein